MRRATRVKRTRNLLFRGERSWRKASSRIRCRRDSRRRCEVAEIRSRPGVEDRSKRARGGRHSSDQITSLVKSTLATGVVSMLTCWPPLLPTSYWREIASSVTSSSTPSPLSLPPPPSSPSVPDIVYSCFSDNNASSAIAAWPRLALLPISTDRTICHRTRYSFYCSAEFG